MVILGIHMYPLFDYQMVCNKCPMLKTDPNLPPTESKFKPQVLGPFLDNLASCCWFLVQKSKSPKRVRMIGLKLLLSQMIEIGEPHWTFGLKRFRSNYRHPLFQRETNVPLHAFSYDAFSKVAFKQFRCTRTIWRQLIQTCQPKK